MPSDVKGEVGLFDRFAKGASRFVSRPWYFALCVLLVLLLTPYPRDLGLKPVL
jgi:low affinity Fe/Cu permease